MSSYEECFDTSGKEWIQPSYTIRKHHNTDAVHSIGKPTHAISSFFTKTYLKFLKTLLHVSVIRPSSGSL